MKLVRESLTPDLLEPQYREANESNPMYGHCYVATEAIYYLLARFGFRGYRKMRAKDSLGIIHWWLEKHITRRQFLRIDITADQYERVGMYPPYVHGKRGPFLTRVASERALEVMRRVNEKIAV